MKYETQKIDREAIRLDILPIQDAEQKKKSFIDFNRTKVMKELIAEDK